MICLACNNTVGVEVLLVCGTCNGGYHCECANIPIEHNKKLKLQGTSDTWRCPSCNNITRRYKNDETPARRHFEQSPTADATDMSICEVSPRQDSSLDDLDHRVQSTSKAKEFDFNNMMQTLSSLLDSKLGNVKQDIASINAKLTTTKQEIFTEIKKEFAHVIERLKDEFSETTDFLSEQILNVTTDLRSIDQKVKNLEAENIRLNAELRAVKNETKYQPNCSELQNTVDQLQVDLNERDQALLLNDIEIIGLPEHKNESPIHIVKAIALKLGLALEERDIVGADRVGVLRTTKTPGPVGPNNEPNLEPSAVPTALRPRPLVVRLARRALRDDLIRSARVRRGLDSGNIGLPDHIPKYIYVNERLTKTNRKILWKTKQAGNQMRWKFVWVKDGRILARRTDSRESKTIHIKTEKDIIRVFGVDPSANTSV